MVHQYIKKETKNSFDVEDDYDSDNSGSDAIFEDIDKPDYDHESDVDTETSCPSKCLAFVHQSEDEDRLKKWIDLTDKTNIQNKGRRSTIRHIPMIEKLRQWRSLVLDYGTGVVSTKPRERAQSYQPEKDCELETNIEVTSHHNFKSPETICDGKNTDHDFTDHVTIQERENKFRYPRWVRLQSSRNIDQSEVFEAVSRVRHASLDNDPELDIRLKRWRELTNIFTGPVASP
jgi:hypothetical protein